MAKRISILVVTTALLAAIAVPQAGASNPVVTTEAATGVAPTQATLHATINPGGHKLAYVFTYGPLDNPYESETPGKFIEGTSDIKVSETISGLDPSTTYVFRAVAADFHSVVGVGQDETFTTLGPTTLCQAAEALCAAEDRYPAETALKASSSEIAIGAGFFEVTCSSSTLEGKTTAESAEPLPVNVSTWTLSGCKDWNGNACTATTVNLPYSGSVAWQGGNDGTLAIASGGTGNPGWSLKCSITCNYGFEPDLAVEGGTPAQLVADEAVISKQAGGSWICPASGTFTATYSVSSPQPLHVATALE